MNSLDELRDRLERYSERDAARGSAAVLADSYDLIGIGARRPRYLTAAVVAVSCLVLAATVFVLRQRTGSLDVITIPLPAGTSTTVVSPNPTLPSLTIADGTVRMVKGGFGRIWVATLDETTGAASSLLRSFDATTGQPSSEVSIVGDIYSFALTDNYIWILASTGGPASFPIGTGGYTDAIYRVDPGSGAATPKRYLVSNGPLVGYGTRIAAADVDHLEIVDENGQEIGASAIDDAVGVDNATFPGTNAITALSYGPTGLFAFHTGREELLALDPDTGRHIASHRIADDRNREFGPIVATAGDYVWITMQFGGLIGVNVPLSDNQAASEISRGSNGRVQEIERLNDRQLLLRSPSAATLIDTGSPNERVETNLNSSQGSSIVMIGSQPWIAQWPHSQEQMPTVVSFVRIAKDAKVHDDEPTPTSSSLHLANSGLLRDGDIVEVTANQLIPGPAVLVACAPDPPETTNHCGVSFAEKQLTIAADGTLRTNFVAQRHIYDFRWNDCAVERCTLELFALTQANGRAAGLALASAALTFDPSVSSSQLPILSISVDGPVPIESMITFTGDNFPPGRKFSIGQCRTAVNNNSSCVYSDASLNPTADTNGHIQGTLKVLRMIGGADCTAGDNVCELAIYPFDGSSEPFAAFPLVITP